jgi:hypothetical protein
MHFSVSFVTVQSYNVYFVLFFALGSEFNELWKLGRFGKKLRTTCDKNIFEQDLQDSTKHTY